MPSGVEGAGVIIARELFCKRNKWTILESFLAGD
jgi:hypothetical protein